MMVPSINCPPDITVQSGLDCKAAANWKEPSTSDNCSNVTNFKVTWQSGSTFDNWEYPCGYYTAIDACGNSSNCSFNITVMN
ncbi:MAG: HYR domain-containing protein [Saprospiraceae bacterium]|nr:HYR domain-containing protein [Candidatus Vicinibacter affinis]